MRVLQICYAYPPSFSGYGRQLATVNAELLGSGKPPEIEVVTAFDGTRSRDGVDIHGMLARTRKAYRWNFVNFYLFCLWLPLRLCRRLGGVDVAHVVKAGPDAMIAVVLARLLRKPVIVKIAQEEYDDAEAVGLLRRLRRRIVSRADALVAISAKIRDDMLRAGVAADRIVDIPNAVDAERFAPVGQADAVALFRKAVGRERKPGETVFLFLGSIGRRKGVHDLLEAVRTMGGRNPAIFLFAGPDSGEISDFAERMGAGKGRGGLIELRYLGVSSEPEKLLQVADALVLPSYSEGMPNVVLESMACGVPVIASDIPVHREIVSPQTGRLFASGDVGSLARLLEDWPDVDKGPLSQSCRETVLANYALPVVARRYGQLYGRLASSKL